MKRTIKIWIECARLRTLPVSVAGVIMASGIAVLYHRFEWLPALLCFAFAVLAQVVSNFANEYYDFRRGTDKKGRVGPRRGVTEGDITPGLLLRVTIGTLAVACAVGCGLIPFGGWWLIPVGILIAVFAFAYSAGPYPLSYHGLGDVAVLVFFGLVPVNLTFYLQAGYFAPLTILASVTIGLMGVNVLLVNNYRDVDDDREAHKRTTVVIFGRKVASAAYLINGYVGISLLAPLWFAAPLWVLAVPALYLVLHTVTWNRLTHSDGAALNPLLGATARNMLIFAVLLTACFGIIAA
ncbi:MAG: 1,4-dihydroxy-2-naphthoate octaprenyltransferase [Muribaculaceae bacterium]|nr:1,4-dihydroxy-2-naphthoate octaprenyltransferase [Muribaculaceae bacterium]